jgi:hypothetical protein
VGDARPHDDVSLMVLRRVNHALIGRPRRLQSIGPNSPVSLMRCQMS